MTSPARRDGTAKQLTLSMCHKALVAALLLAFLWSAHLGATLSSPLIQAHYLEDADLHLTASQALTSLRNGQGATIPGARFNQGNKDSHY